MVQNQKLSANTTVRIQNLEQKLMEVTGSLKKKTTIRPSSSKRILKPLKKKINIFQELDQNNQAQIDNLSNDIEIIKIKLEENKVYDQGS